MCTLVLMDCWKDVNSPQLQKVNSCLELLSSKILLKAHEQQEGNEKVSTTNSSPVSLSATSLWSEYSCLHMVDIEPKSFPCAHSSPSAIQVVTFTSCRYSSDILLRRFRCRDCVSPILVINTVIHFILLLGSSWLGRIIVQGPLENIALFIAYSIKIQYSPI